MKQRIIELITWNCALADHSKLQTKAQYVFAIPSDIHLLVTDQSPSTETAVAFSKSHLEIKVLL